MRKLLAKLAGTPEGNGYWSHLRQLAFAETGVWLTMTPKRYVSDKDVTHVTPHDDGLHVPPETFKKLVCSERVSVKWSEGEEETLKEIKGEEAAEARLKKVEATAAQKAAEIEVKRRIEDEAAARKQAAATEEAERVSRKEAADREKADAGTGGK